VFDVDGTLVDSRAVIQRGSDLAFDAMGMARRPYEQVRQTIGLSLIEGLARLAPELDSEALERLAAAFKEVYAGFHKDPDHRDPLYPGAAELLDALKADGWLIAMATGQSRRGVERTLQVNGWADLFDSTHCADDGPGKPHPSMLLEAMRTLGASAAETVMIGDTAHDMLMARAAGVRAQGVAWGFHTLEEVRASGADHIANDFAELRAELDRFAAALG